MKLETLARKTVVSLGLKSLATRTLGAVGLEYYPTTEPGRNDLYPELVPSEKFDSTVKVNFPQADAWYRPSLFLPTERRPTRIRLNNMLDIKIAFQTLYGTMRRLGCAVNGCDHDGADMTVEWAGKYRDYRPATPPIIMEHGWLPRLTYQISETGANARSHVARAYRDRTLTSRQEEFVRKYLARMRCLFRRQLNAEKAAEADARFSQPFILFPLQLANDFNLRYSNSPFDHLYGLKPKHTVRFAQACVDHVEAARLPLPVLFKQHPGDENELASRLRIRDPRNQLITNDERLGTQELFASGGCKLVISVNSNTLHEALAWDIPVISLGTLLWDESRDDRPLDKELNTAKRLIDRQTALDAPRLSYLYHVITHQWHLSDFHNPLIVQELMRTRANCVPYELRCRFGFDVSNDGGAEVRGEWRPPEC